MITRLLERHTALVVFAVGLLIRVAFIHLHPMIFGGDSVLRLANRERILLGYQLPLLQTAIYAISRLTDGLLPVRYLMALIGGIAGAGFYFLASIFLNRTAALWAALLFASNPFLIELSIVPYQEVLMLAGLLFSFYWYFSGRWIACGLSLGLACLTRYEAWAACPVLALGYWMHRDGKAKEAAKAAVLFGWAPLAWIAYHRALSAGGTFVVEPPLSLDRLMRYVYLSWITMKNTPVPALLLALLGTSRLWQEQFWKDTRYRVLIAFLGLFLLAILFSAHGEAPNPERFVTAREATILITAVIFVAGFALKESRRIRIVLALTGIGLGLFSAQVYLTRDTSEPHIQLSYALANFLDRRLQQGERVAILTRPLPKELVDSYLSKVSAKGGDAELRRARAILAKMVTSPPDYQRTLIHSKLGRERLLSFASTAGPTPEAAGMNADDIRWVAVWTDFIPGNETEAYLRRSALARGRLVQTLRSGPVGVFVYRLADM